MQEVRHAESPPLCNFSDEHFTELQSFRYVQAPTLANPPDCSHRTGSKSVWAAGTFTPRNERVITHTNRGITTCLNRTIGAAGLSPARLRPFRPLPAGHCSEVRFPFILVSFRAPTDLVSVEQELNCQPQENEIALSPKGASLERSAALALRGLNSAGRLCVGC